MTEQSFRFPSCEQKTNKKCQRNGVLVTKSHFLIPISIQPEMEFIEFEPRFKSAKTRFKLSAGLNLETFDTILSGTNHI